MAFLEPIALYMTKDLYEDKDGLWSFSYPAPAEHVELGEGRVYDETAGDLTILSWSNGLYLSLRAARRLERGHGIRTRVGDLRWLKPLPRDWILKQAAATGRVLVFDGFYKVSGVGEEILALLLEEGDPAWEIVRIAGEDCYIPLGAAALHMLPTEEDIVKKGRAIAQK